MNKLFTKIAALFLGMTMAVGVGVAVGSGSKASEVKAGPGTVYNVTTDNLSRWTTSQAAQTGTSGDFTLSAKKSGNTGGGAATGGQIRLYKKGTFTIQCTTGDMSEIVFTCAASGTDNYGPGNLSTTGYTYSGEKGTWSGSSTSVSFSVNSNNQCRITNIKITYDNGVTTPTLTISDPEMPKLPVGYEVTSNLEAIASNFKENVSFEWTITSGADLVNKTSSENTCSITSKSTNTNPGNVTVQVRASDGETTLTTSKTINIINVNTVAQSIAATPATGKSEMVYTSGKVNGYYKTGGTFTKNIDEAAEITSSGQAKFFISDDGEEGSASTRIELYNCLDLGKAAFTEYPVLGTEIVVCGTLEKYKETYEHSANCFLVKKEAPHTPVISAIALDTDDVTKEFEINDEFNYDGLVVTATVDDVSGVVLTSTEYSVSTPDMTTSGQKTITVTYSGTKYSHEETISASYNINVLAPSPDATIKAINDIGTVVYTQASYNLIKAARDLYKALPTESQKGVTNYQTLLDAEASFSTLKTNAVNNVISLITAIGEVTLDSGDEIETAEAAYNALLEGDLGKNLVTNYSTLTAAKTAYDKMVSDKEAADAVTLAINNLPSPSSITDYSHHADIVDARTAYNALTDDQKKYVTAETLQKLVDCEEAEAPYQPLDFDIDTDGGMTHGKSNSDASAGANTATDLESGFPVGTSLISWKSGSKAYKANTNDKALKLGTSSSTGSVTLSFAHNRMYATTVTLDAYSWSGKTITLSVNGVTKTLSGYSAALTFDLTSVAFTGDVTIGTTTGSSEKRVTIFGINIAYAYRADYSAAKTFETDFIKKDIAYPDVTPTGVAGKDCLSTEEGGKGYYDLAEARYNSAEFGAAARLEFATHDDFAKARERFQAWARANGKSITFNQETGAIEYNTRSITLPTIFGESSNATAIVVIVSVVSLTAIGGYFFLKKRREQN